MTTSTALLLADLTGVAVFAASGASAAVAKRLDLFGVAFVGFVAALGGGIFRDLVIDEVPPLAFADWRYAATAAITALAVFWLHPQLARLRTTVLVLDAAGPGLFTVTGTLKALDARVPAVGACLIGMLTAHRRRARPRPAHRRDPGRAAPGDLRAGRAGRLGRWWCCCTSPGRPGPCRSPPPPSWSSGCA